MIDAATRRMVRARAGDRCEYCGLRQEHSPVLRFHVEHIISHKHGGGDDADNLALACIDCNLAKGPNIAGIDPLTKQLTELFNPRRQRWNDHFAWNGPLLAGKTAAGRATIEVLRINSDEHVELRLALAAWLKDA